MYDIPPAQNSDETEGLGEGEESGKNGSAGGGASSQQSSRWYKGLCVTVWRCDIFRPGAPAWGGWPGWTVAQRANPGALDRQVGHQGVQGPSQREL